VLRNLWFGHFDGGVHACGCRHVNQGVQRKQVYLSAHQVGNTGLGDAKKCSGIALRHFPFADYFGHVHHQFGACPHTRGLLWGVFNGIPHAAELLFVSHFESSFTSSLNRLRVSSISGCDVCGVFFLKL
jgi:hypothetical protein